MNKKGFTLIELLIVVTIIGILAVALVPRIVGGSAGARDSRRLTDVQTIYSGLEYYLLENGNFAEIDDTNPVCAADLASELSGFLKSVPGDPLDNQENVAFGSACTGDYAVLFLQDSSSGVTRFAIGAKMEASSEGDEYVFDTPSTGTTYAAFTAALSDYTGADTQVPYYVAY